MSSKRSDLIFGLHCDFHANENSPAIGKNLTEESIQQLIDTVKPQFIQCDCKGHNGFSSYPTKVGCPAPVIEKDILRMWRDVTKRNGIPLYVHYSGVFDAQAVKEHPEWGVMTDDGELHSTATSLFSDYAERLMIPQLCELAGEYGVDGAWVDGDCWGVLRDQGDKIKKEFFELYGIERLPVKRGDEGFDEYLELLRIKFREYLNKYTNEVHKQYPDFQIASNWAFSSYMPEKAMDCVDFLSGDVHGSDTVELSAYEAKYLSSQGKPWDLMPWWSSRLEAESSGTGNSTYGALKSTVQLSQEAAEILAHGGAFQVYYPQRADGSVNPEAMLAAGLSEFCLKRKPFCFRGNSRAEIAVFYSTKSAYSIANEAFGFMDGNLDFLHGDVSLLSSLGLPIDFLSEHNLFNDIDRYSLIVVPEWENLFDNEKLLSFVQRGGNLLVIGSKAVRSFENVLGIEIEGIKQNEKIILSNSHLISEIGVNTDIAIADIEASTPISYLEAYDDGEIRKFVAATVSDYGNGKIGAVYFDMGLMYKRTKDIVLSDFVKKVVDCLIPLKRAEVLGSRYVDIVLSEIDGRLCANLVNKSGPHTDPTVMTYDEIPCVTDITLRVKCEQPMNVYREPDHISVPFTYENGMLEVKIEKLEIYDIYVIE